MKRTVEIKQVAGVLDSIAEAEYNVALARNEDLWDVKRGIDERIYFLFLIGLVTDEERLKTQTLLRIELLFLAVTFRVDDTFVLEHDLDAGVQEREFAHTVREDLPVVHGLGEDGIIRPELHERTRLALLPITGGLCLGNHMNRR